MNKLIKNIALLMCISIFISSCETIDYGNTNESPNGPTSPVTSQLFASALTWMDRIMVDEKAILYMQHITQGQYPGSSRYETLTASYDAWYTGPMMNLNEIININEEAPAGALAYGATENQLASAKLLRAFYLQYMTDRWGYLPWTEAFQGIENTSPAFDSQESLYNFMFAEVDAALAMISSDTGPTGDFMFGGDMDKWAAFGNNLKATMALRISDVNPSLAKTKFEQAAASGMIVMDNADNLEYNYGTDAESNSPWYDNFETREDYILSVTMVENLRSNLDPRLFEMAEEARDSVHPSPNFPGGIDAGYVGAPNGAVNGNVPDYSFITSDIIYEHDFPSPIYTAAQMRFALSEAALKGWTVTGDAATHYAAGIQASMDYWGVDPADATAYIAAHPYTGIADIAYEKWVALYLNGPEAWAEWRRLDAPYLPPSPFAAVQEIPKRDAYDPSVEDNNAVNYAAVVAAQGIDDIYTKLWWDVN
ncbi:SusD/RagB family nutrient-binding outer membrane lipoprotein [Pontimicrobium aquaticum]|uniref:SusD/RagB family nutrient-binding outer membrane lipoprotein n=1 Tax=Pontimicrobium aquaticum TaxID=2565367 RepID=A0A4V5LQZ4_9FLAO|nr:SusD/RagB family nutrient-binding outer membrane lipoprotein [Pontimicrobium aquaticum]TJY37079.1 SusD/RagB family nutrient-binding outer membrane lipoprotein [Pontimicrobium aquaticum]